MNQTTTVKEERRCLEDDELKGALASLLSRGEWKDPRDGSIYKFLKIPNTYLGDVEAFNGGVHGSYTHCVPSVVLKWIFKRINSDASIASVRVLGLSASCPFCEHDVCEAHFASTLKEYDAINAPYQNAYFITGDPDFILCDCDTWHKENVCPNCGHVEYHEAGNPGEE